MFRSKRSIEDVWLLDQEAIMFDLIGHKGKSKFRNPLRSDKHSGAWLDWYGNRLLLIDLAWKHSHCDVVKLTQLIHNCNQVQAINLIFSKSYQAVVPQFHNKNKYIISPYFREWSNRDQAYWNKYDLDIEWIQEFNKSRGVLFGPISRYLINGTEAIPLRVAYAYVFNSNHVKIYMPTSSRKWISNHDAKDLYFENDNLYDTCIVGSSYKDLLVIAKEIPDISLRAYSTEATSEFTSWRSKFKRVVISGDNDEAGLKAQEIYKLKLDAEGYVLDSEQKDWSDCKEANKDKFNENIENLKCLIRQEI